MTTFGEFKRYNDPRYWRWREGENLTKAEMFKDPACRQTMLRLAAGCAQSAKWAEQLQQDGAMRSKGGLHPYDAGLFFIARERHGGGWPPRDVARDLIAIWRAVEDGHLAP